MCHSDLVLRYNSCTYLLCSSIPLLTKILHRNLACNCKKAFFRQFLIHLTQDFLGFSHAHTEHICDVFCTVVNFFVHTVLPFLCFCIVSFCFVFIISQLLFRVNIFFLSISCLMCYPIFNTEIFVS